MKEIKEKLHLAMTQFYLAQELDKPLMTDLEFDNLRSQYPDLVKEIFDEFFGKEMNEVDQVPIKGLEKLQIRDNDLKSAVSSQYDDETHYCTLKYDGSSIRAYYRNGVLLRILGSPDGTSGIDRTANFWNLFPTTIDIPGEVSLVGEVLVDYDQFGELARNKANGLTNSIHKSSEVESECFIRIYRVEVEGEEFDYNQNLIRLGHLPTVVSIRSRLGHPSIEDVVFSDCVIFDEGSPEFPTTSHSSIGEAVTFQLDGVVVYSPDGILGFKYYYTQSVETKVTGIDWKLQSNGGYAPTLLIDEIELNEKSIKRVSPNGVRTLLDLGCGIGSTVEVILANSTIPKINRVVVESEDYQFPKCDCGYQMGPDDIFGNVLKCGSGVNPCCTKVNSWKPQLIKWIQDDTLFTGMNTVMEMMTSHPEFFCYTLFIDRWDPFDKMINTTVDPEGLLHSIQENSTIELTKWVEDNFHLTDLQSEIMKSNIGSSLEVLKWVSTMTIEDINNFEFE